MSDDEMEYNNQDLIGQMISVPQDEKDNEASAKKDSAKKKRVKKNIKRDNPDFEFDVDNVMNSEEGKESDEEAKPKKKKQQDDDDYEESAGNDDEETIVHKNKKPKIKTKKTKKARREKKHNFIEDYADEDDDVEDDYEVVGEVGDQELRRIEEEAIKRKDQRMTRNTADFADELIKKYQHMEYQDIEDDIDAGELIDEEEAIYNRQPKATDPKLWLVKCKKGKERENVFTLLKKYFFNAKSMNLKIFSAFSIDALKGYIYVEAYKEANVREAVIGISTIKPDSIKQVPTHEMTQVLNFDKLEKVELKKNQWVRIKSGLYENDIAQIIDIEDSANKIWIKIIPRMFENTEKMKIGDYSKQMKSTIKPKQQFFNADAVQEVQTKVHPFLKVAMNLWKSKYFKDGFFIKCAKLKSLVYKDVVPKIEELRIFESANETKENQSSFIDSLYKNINDLSIVKKNKYLKGEKVKLFTGNLQGIIGEVISHEGETVKLISNVEGLDDELEVPEQYLTRYFIPGDLVTVEKDTRLKGMSGIVVKTEGDIATVYNESSMTEFKVSMENLILSCKVAKNDITISNDFSPFDLVSTTGVGGTQNQYCLVLDIQPFKLTVMDLKAKILQIATSQAKKINTK